MLTLNDLLSKINKDTSSSTFVLYGTAVTNSANGEVLIKLDDPVDETTEEGIELLEVDEDDTVYAIDEDAEADELPEGEDPEEIDSDETDYYIPDGGTDETEYDPEPEEEP